MDSIESLSGSDGISGNSRPLYFGTSHRRPPVSRNTVLSLASLAKRITFECPASNSANRKAIVIKSILSTVVVLALTISIFADEPQIIYEGDSDHAPKQPQAIVSKTGVTHITFGVGNRIYYCNNSGGKFDPPTFAFEIPNLSLGMRRGPRIADTGESIVITAIGGPEGKGKDGDLLAYRTDDNGKNWSGPVKVNDVDASAREGLHAMTSTEKGVLWCVWLDLRAQKTELYVSKSTDDGKSWSRNQLVYRSPDGSICECCHPSIVANQDSVNILFRNSIEGKRDMYLVTFYDRGANFRNVIRLGVQQWLLDICPMDGGMLCTSNNGKPTTVWRRGRMIYTSENRVANESMIGRGEQPWICCNSQTTYVVWTSRREGELHYKNLETSETGKIADNARDPVIVAGNSENAPFQIFWEQRSGNQFRIMCQQVR